MSDARLTLGLEEDPLLLDRQICFPLYAATNLLGRLYGPVLRKLNLTFTLDRPAPKFIVRTKSGSRLEFAIEQPQNERDAFASALSPAFDQGRVLDMGAAQGGS